MRRLIGEKSQLRKILWGLLIAVLAFPVLPLLDHFGRPELERPVYFSLGLILIAIKVCWELRSRPWFWITIIAIAALHVPLIVLTAQWLFRTPFSTMFFWELLISL